MIPTRFLADRLGRARSEDDLNIRVRLGITTFKQGACDKWASAVISSAPLKPAYSLRNLAPGFRHVEDTDWLLTRILEYNINVILKTVPDSW